MSPAVSYTHLQVQLEGLLHHEEAERRHEARTRRVARRYARVGPVSYTHLDVYKRQEIVQGVRNFCINYHKKFEVKDTINDEILETKTAYIVVEENDLAELAKKVKQAGYTLGKEIGLISFNETTLKELLGITVVSTDFETMGRTAAVSYTHLDVYKRQPVQSRLIFGY